MIRIAGQPRKTLAGRFVRMLFCRKGTSAIEFALIAPVFMMILAGIADIGGLLSSRSGVSAAVTAGSNFLLVNAARVASSPEEVLRQTAAVAGNSLPSGSVTRIVVNDGLTATFVNGKVSTSGKASSAAQCFCPQVTGSSMSLGSAVECGVACGSGGYSGRYVNVEASHSYTPLFDWFGMVAPDGTVHVRSTVKLP